MVDIPLILVAFLLGMLSTVVSIAILYLVEID